MDTGLAIASFVAGLVVVAGVLHGCRERVTATASAPPSYRGRELRAGDRLLPDEEASVYRRDCYVSVYEEGGLPVGIELTVPDCDVAEWGERVTDWIAELFAFEDEAESPSGPSIAVVEP